MKRVYLTFFIVYFISLQGQVLWGAEPGYLFGPQKLMRSDGAAEESSKDSKISFENCEPKAQYQLVIENGNEDGTLRVRSGKIKLNGQELVKSKEFNKKTYSIKKFLGILPGPNLLEVKLRSKRERFIHLRVECVSDCLSVGFRSPPAEGSTHLPLVSVFGAYQSSAEQAGIVVNGYPAFVYKDGFIVNHIPLGGGVNALHAQITNSCGMRAEEKLSMTVRNVVDPPVKILPSSSSGIAPFSTKLESLVQISMPITLYQWDFEGDGIIDAENIDLAEIVHLYPDPGIYRPSLTVVDSQGNRYSDQVGIVVLNPSEIDVLLTKQWNTMKNHLLNGEIEAAMGYFAEGSSKAMFRHNFTLMKDHLPQIVSEM
ncbi:MAG: PKD domain-containing protein, partial [Nitrospinota bacterium]